MWCPGLPADDGIGYRDFPVNEQRVKYILSKQPGKVLDIGCAMGYLVKKLRAAEVDAWGCDVSRYALAQAPDDVRPYLRYASAHRLPYADKEFDFVVSFSTFEHLSYDQLQWAADEVLRVAQRGIIAVCPGDDPHFDEDATHEIKRPLEWWRRLFPPAFEVLTDRDEDWTKLVPLITPPSVLVKLNLGSFVDVIADDWENIDILDLRAQIPLQFKFRQWDLRRGIPYPDNSVDLIRMSHLIEHLTLEEAAKLCREIYRVLMPGGGLVRISTPDISLILRHYQTQDMSFFNSIQPPEYITAYSQGEKLSRILFSGDYQHKAIYDFGFLANLLQQGGFQSSRISKVSPGFSHSLMMQEVPDAHVEVSLVVEAIK